MAWVPGDITNNPTAGAVLAQTAPFTHARHVHVTVVVATTLGFQAFLQVVDRAGSVVNDQSQLLPVGRLLEIVRDLGPIKVNEGQRLRLTARNAVDGAEVQACLFVAG